MEKGFGIQNRISKTLFIFLFPFLSGCSHLAYQPTPYIYSNPTKYPGFEQIKFPSIDDVELCAWYFPPKLAIGEQPQGVIVQFHGNAENMSSHVNWLTWATKKGYGIFTFDYRGYGLSKGDPTQLGLNEDALAAIRYVQSRSAHFHSDIRLILYGQSLGGAVLMRALDDLYPAEKKAVSAVVIQSSFYSYRKESKYILSSHWITTIFQPLTPLLMSDDFSPEESIARIAPLPLLVIHGDQDNIVSVEFGKKIFDLAHEPKQLLIIPGGEHLFNPPQQELLMEEEILKFLNHSPAFR